MASLADNPVGIYAALTRERGSRKEAALRAVDKGLGEADRRTLRSLLVNALTSEFLPPQPGQEDEMRSRDARCWLLSALGRVAEDDSRSEAELARHLDPKVESHRWARYWALEGLISGKARNLESICRNVVENDDDDLVTGLARAYLASKGDPESLTAVQDGLEEESQATWAILRGLRIVAVASPAVVRSICNIIDKGGYLNNTFDAIIALGRIPHDSVYADVAAQALSNYLVTYRWPMYEAMRVRALCSLASLRVERSAPILIEELSDDSQGIISAAARALEAVLGVRTATKRILEFAISADADTQVKLAGALRFMDRANVVDELESAMLAGPDAVQTAARTLLSEVGGAQAFQRLAARTTAANQYLKLLDEAETKIRTLFEDSIVEARRGFRLAALMDGLVFAVGIALIVASGVGILLAGGKLDSWVGVGATGGTGVLATLYGILVANPRRQITESVDHLMHLKVVFLAYLRRLHQTDQAFTRRLLDDEDLDPAEVGAYAQMVANAMDQASGGLDGRGRARAAKTQDPASPPPG